MQYMREREGGREKGELTLKLLAMFPIQRRNNSPVGREEGRMRADTGGACVCCQDIRAPAWSVSPTLKQEVSLSDESQGDKGMWKVYGRWGSLKQSSRILEVHVEQRCLAGLQGNVDGLLDVGHLNSQQHRLCTVRSFSTGLAKLGGSKAGS